MSLSHGVRVLRCGCTRMLRYPGQTTPTRTISQSTISKTDPSTLTLDDEGLWYTLTAEDNACLNFSYNLPSGLRKQAATLGETSILVRRQSLDLLQCLKVSVDSALPINRYLLYGKKGTGKSATVFQALHFAKSQGWLSLHVPYVLRWSRRARDKNVSSWKPERMDQPAEGTTWLQNFLKLNAALIPLLQKLQISQDYNWSTREASKKGDSLLSVVNMGIDRSVFSCDCVGALLKELKVFASKGDVKILLAIDQANSLFFLTRVRTPDHGWTEANDLTMIHHFRKMIQSDWSGGAAVLTADEAEFFISKDKPTTNYPLALFKKEALKSIEPFVPIETKLYSDKEMTSVLNYYLDKGWLVTPEAQTESGQKLIKHLCAGNPWYLDYICATA